MAISFGSRALVKLCEEQDLKGWFRKKLNVDLFNPTDAATFTWVQEFVSKYHKLPDIETLGKKFPALKSVEAVEPASYYVDGLETAWLHSQLNRIGVGINDIMGQPGKTCDDAFNHVHKIMGEVYAQKYRTNLTSLKEDAKKLMLAEYHNVEGVENQAIFGWDYLDSQGGAEPGDIVSIIGRPQAGKSFLSIYIAMENMLTKKHKVLVASMEMATKIMFQRATAMMAGTNLTQLKLKQYATPTYKKYREGLECLSSLEGDIIVMNGNLAVDVESIYEVAEHYECQSVVIDGAYLCRHKNSRLDRFQRAAENCEIMKRYTEDLGVVTFSSWQFNREAAKKKGQEKAGLEDIGYTDAIGQISSIVLGMFQEDGNVDSIATKKIRVMKGRGGEVGEFDIHWDFDKMNFAQISNGIPDTQDL